MKIRTPHLTRKNIILGSLIVIIIACFAVSAYLYTSSRDKAEQEPRGVNTIDYSEPTKEDVEKTETAKQEVIQKNEQREKSDINNEGSVNLSLNRLSQAPNGGAINVRSIVTGATTGQCTAIFTNGGNRVERTFEISILAEYYTCNTDIPQSDFQTKGTWNLELSAVTNSKRSNIEKRDVEIK